MLKERILLVEDDAIESMDIKNTLESFGYEVPFIASRGEEAVEKARKEMPDLILMDIILKGEIDGIEAASKIKELDIPLIFLTAHSEEATVQKAKLTGPYGYLIKPYDPFELKYTIELALYKNKMEKKLKRSEKRYKSIVETANEGIWGTDADFNITYVNPKIAEMLGYTAEEMLGKHVTFFMFEEDIPDRKKHIEKRIEGHSETYERRFRHKNGSEVSTIVSVTAIMDDNGDFTGTFSMFTDITDRKEMEKELITSQNQLHDIIDSSPILQFVIDKNHRVIHWNQAITNYSNISPEEILGTDNHWRAFYSEKRPCLADLMVDKGLNRLDELYGGKYGESEHLNGAYDIEDFFPSMGENGKWLHFTATALEDSEGNITGALETLEDITDRKIAEEALKESEEKFRVLAENAPLSIIVYQDNRAVYVNNYAAKISGYSKEELYGMNFWDSFHPDDQELLKKRGKARLRGDKVPSRYEIRYLTKSGEIRYVDVSAGNIIYDGKPAGLAMLVDINDRKLAETALKNSEAEYKAIFENIKSAVAVYNAIEDGNDFVFKDFNRSAEQIEQIQKADVIGKRVTEVFQGVIDFGLLEVFQRVWKTGKPERHPVSIYHDERIKGWRENYVYKLPSEDIVAVYDDLTEIKQYEEELEQNQVRLKSLVRILQYRAESVQDLLDYALEEAIKLTESKLGYIYHYDEDRKEFILNTWSKGVMDECRITDQQSVYELDKTGIWGEAVRQRKPIILNDFQAENLLKKGYPEGHAPLHKFMTIPIFTGDEIVAVVGVANKESDYTETDVLQLELLMDGVWKVVGTKKVEEALEKSETRYRAIFENTGTATAISENDTTLSLVNDEFAILTGYSKEEIENKMCWVDFFVEEELPRMKEYHRLRRIDPDAAPKNYESVLRDKEGNRKDVYMNVAMLPSTEKTLVSVLDITEKKQSRIKLRRELKINKSLAKIYVPLISPLTTIQEISISILKESLSLSGSEHGFVATIDPENRDLINQTLTKMMPQCEVYGDGKIPEEIRFPIGPDGMYRGLWGHCLNTKEAFYTNEAEKHPSAEGAPEGHVKIEKFMAVPVLIDDELVGEIALANPLSKDYSDKDLKAVNRISEFFAFAIQRKGYEEQINKSLDEKDILLREVHHRVKNNMQIISSILNLQSNKVKDSALLDILKQNQNRIKSMAMIHEKLYQSSNLVEIDFSDYIRSLTADIFYTYFDKAEGIEIDLDLDKDILLNIETSIPCGLIYSELISNSIKHAFPMENKGEIRVEFKKDDNNLMLMVCDNGVGLSDDLDFRKTESLGLQLVNNLVNQIDGTIELDKANGTKFTIRFQELKYKDRI